MKCKYGHLDIRLSAPKYNGQRYIECRACDRTGKRFTRHQRRLLLQIGALVAEARGTRR